MPPTRTNPDLSCLKLNNEFEMFRENGAQSPVTDISQVNIEQNNNLPP